MDDKLKMTLSFYEEEKINLQKMIDDCVDEQDFLIAHYHTIALNQLQNKIDALESIDDRLIDKKKSIQHRIENLERIVKSKGQLGVTTSQQEMLIEARQKLEILNQEKNPILSNTDSSFKFTLIKLLTKRIKKFNLILIKSENLFLEFNFSKRTIKITMPFIKHHQKSYLFDKNSIKTLQRFGFNYTSNSSRLILKYSGNNEEIIEKVITIVSIIVFEIFSPNYFIDESFIEIF